MSLSKKAQAEMELLRKEHKGLTPRQVLDFARDEDTELHKCFEWDDGEAAERYRLIQASAVIRGYVISYDDQGPPIRAVYSLVADRKRNDELGSGIRRNIEDIVEDEALRAQLLQTALGEMRSFRRKYERLKELKPVWDAMDKVLPAPKAEEMRVSA